MKLPLEKLNEWLEEEKRNGNIFPQGAVLSTISKNGTPRSRVVGTMLDEKNIPKFFTSPSSRKVADIKFSNRASLTYSFQNTVRSISFEGTLSELASAELDNDWLKHDDDFRKHYIIFGSKSGSSISSLNDLRKKRDNINPGDLKIRPKSFIGFKFASIDRISFYSVIEGDFAINDVYNWDRANNRWDHILLVP
ncbi:MAG: pyridoxamine 5'-phosphate oxidase family protein [Leptospirales bacterium]